MAIPINIVAPTNRGGRARGSRNRVVVQREILAARGLSAALNDGLTPLEVMLHRMRGTRDVSDQQFAAAVAAAPYVHPKLCAVAYKEATVEESCFDLSELTNEELALMRRVLTRNKTA